jgi:hypothetical protein
LSSKFRIFVLVQKGVEKDRRLDSSCVLIGILQLCLASTPTTVSKNKNGILSLETKRPSPCPLLAG